MRATSQAREHPEWKDPSHLDEWKNLIQQVISHYHERDQHSAVHFAEERSRLNCWVDVLLERLCTQSGDVAVQNRLRKQAAHLLVYLDEPAAEPTNNRAERALGPAVIARKLSCGNKKEADRSYWHILTSLAARCDGLFIDFVAFLTARLPLAVQAG